MSALVFVDTNVLVYSVDAGAGEKRAAACLWLDGLWRTRRGRLSFQVLQEFYVTVARKQPAALELAQDTIRDLLAWQPVAVDGSVLEQAWALEQRYRLSFWDALIASSAKAQTCAVLLTEDLQDGQQLDGLRVLNPFRHRPVTVDLPE